ncbi:MAG TPA: geranylgeranyl reductase family protein [Acidimicrobiales bacterium]
MPAERADVAVIGAGPAGSAAALVLARAGARVALVDKTRFPRDKACGDLVGPRGVQVLDDLGVRLAGAELVGDMRVVGPTGRSVRLPCRAGRTYPGHGVALPRVVLDETLRDAALDAGCVGRIARAGAPLGDDGRLAGFELSDGTRLRADVVIGADGAMSRVASAAGLVDEGRVLWGFALRLYFDAPVDLPTIVLWDEGRWRGFPGYGWIFPGPGGRANLGVGVGVLGDRAAAGHASRSLGAFVAVLDRFGLLDHAARLPAERLGGWLKMGMVGTTPARGPVLLAGDAAGLVNPLQGEGISEALASGRAAAEAVLACPAAPATHYRSFLAQRYASFHASNAAIQAALVRRATVVAATGRLLTAPVIGRAIAGGWALYWNELLDGATPGAARTTAGLATTIARVATSRSQARRSVMNALTKDT